MLNACSPVIKHSHVLQEMHFVIIPVAPDNILRSYEAKRSVCARNWTLYTFTFMHLADAFIQSDLHCIQVTVLHFFYQLLLSLGIEPMILALLAPCSTIWATGKPNYYLWVSGKWSRVMSGSQMNHSFESVLFGELDESDWFVWISSQLEHHRSTSYSVKLTFRCLTVTPTGNEPK